jgi:hypothetical protein
MLLIIQSRDYRSAVHIRNRTPGDPRRPARPPGTQHRFWHCRRFLDHLRHTLHRERMVLAASLSAANGSRHRPWGRDLPPSLLAALAILPRS